MELQQQNKQLAAQLNTLKENLMSAQQGNSSGIQTEQVREYKDALSSLKKKYDVQLQERAALKVILEKKMKALIDSIAATTLANKPPATAGAAPGAAQPPASAIASALPPRTKREIEVLQRLVEASLTALKNSDKDGGSEHGSEQGSVSGASTPVSISGSVTPVQMSTSRPLGAVSSNSQPSSGSLKMPHSASTSSLPSAASNSRSASYPGVQSNPALPASHSTPSLSNLDALIAQRREELQRLNERLQ